MDSERSEASDVPSSGADVESTNQSTQRWVPDERTRRWGIASIVLGIPGTVVTLILVGLLPLGLIELQSSMTPTQVYWINNTCIALLAAAPVAVGFVLSGASVAMHWRFGRALLLLTAMAGLAVAGYQGFVFVNDMHQSDPARNLGEIGLVVAAPQCLYCLTLISRLRGR